MMRRHIGRGYFPVSIFFVQVFFAFTGGVESLAHTSTQALQISNVQATQVTSNAASILWNTNRTSSTWVYYGTTPQYGLAASHNAVYVTSHRLNLTGLTPGTVYHFMVKSADKYGYTASSGDSTFWTLPAITPSPSPVASPSPLPSPLPSITPSPSPVPTSLGTSASDWDMIYNGYGSVTFDPVQGIIMQPETSTTPSATEACLVLSHAYSQNPIQNFTVSVVVATEQQLRTPTPNPWEVFWLFFNYRSGSATPDGLKETNFFEFKTNGIELGTAFNSIGETYLATASSPVNLIGSISTIQLTKVGQQVSVMINGIQVVNYTGTAATHLLYDVPGTIGLYTEDARVHIYSVEVTPL